MNAGLKKTMIGKTLFAIALALAVSLPAAGIAATYFTATTNSDVDSLETVATFDVSNLERASFEITVATADLTAFAVQARLSGAGSFVTLYSAAGDYTSPTGILVGTSGDLTTLAVGTGWLILDVAGIDAIRFRAAGTSSSVTIQGMGL